MGRRASLPIGGGRRSAPEEPLYTPPPLRARMVVGGLLGPETGRGFYANGT